MSARPPLEAVLFDAGGTLVRLDFEWMSERLAGLGLQVPAEALRRAEVEGRRAYDRSRGHAPAPGELPPPLGSVGDTRAYFGVTLLTAGVPGARVDDVLEAFLERQATTGLWTRPMEGAREAIDALAGMGLRLAVVSNSDGRAEQHLVDCAVREGLEFIVDSHVVGIEKPDPGIFRIALERLGIAAPRALFVGDIRSVDEAGAAAAGTRFVLIDPHGDYAPAGRAAIPDLQALAPWVAATFSPIRSTPDITPSSRP